MQTLAANITVNGIRISPEEINAEIQYHPAENLVNARHKAIRALIIREILIQRATELGLCTRRGGHQNPDKVIDTLLAQEITVPEASEEACRRYYDNNKSSFFTPPLFALSHILYLAPPGDPQARKEARNKAEYALTRINQEPRAFETIARQESACPSGKNGGQLGQIGKGQTVPAFENALFQMREGQISEQPIATEVGFHIIKVHRRVERSQLPFIGVADRIKKKLKQKGWNKIFNQYIRLLAGRAQIRGFHLQRDCDLQTAPDRLQSALQT